jgi:hypothetical protein
MEMAMNYSNDYGFDVIDYVKKLRNVGISPAAAEVQGQELSHALKTMGREMKTEIKQELNSDNLATKNDIQEVKNEIREVELRLRKDLQLEIANTKNELIKWVLGIGITASIVTCSAMFTMLKLLIH